MASDKYLGDFGGAPSDAPGHGEAAEAARGVPFDGGKGLGGAPATKAITAAPEDKAVAAPPESK